MRLVIGLALLMVAMSASSAGAQWGFWTYCQVNLADGSQIAVVNAKTFKACMSAGKKCAENRPYTNIYHSTNAFLQTSKIVHKCLIPS